MLIYATTTDLTNWVAPDTITGNPAALLRSASLAVREGTEAAFYAADSTGLPTDATILQAFKDATCAQAAALDAAKVNPAAGGVLKAGVATGKKIGTAAVRYADAESAAAAKQALLTSLCPDAARILTQAGVIPAAPWVVG